MKYITVTLNPALDMNIALSGPLATEGLNRSVGASFSPGGKGINVSAVLTTLGIPNTAVFFSAGFVGEEITRLLSVSGKDAILELVSKMY
jgi:1-phosphofructokinase